MGKLRNSVTGDRALREFYEACGLSPEIIEGAIKLRYQEPTTVANRNRAIAEVMARPGRPRPKMRRGPP